MKDKFMENDYEKIYSKCFHNTNDKPAPIRIHRSPRYII